MIFIGIFVGYRIFFLLVLKTLTHFKSIELIKIDKKILIFIFSVILVVSSFSSAVAQTNQQIIQFSGVVLGSDSTNGIQGVHLYVPKARRGTTTNPYGYFSMPVLAGDSIIVSAVGYKKQFYAIPFDKGENITKFFELEIDTTLLEEVSILPYPTEREFKEAVLAFQLPSDIRSQDNMSEDILAMMMANLPADGGETYNTFLNQQFYQTHNRHYYNPNPISTFLNPFAWSKLIKSIKRGDFKKKKK